MVGKRFYRRSSQKSKWGKSKRNSTGITNGYFSKLLKETQEKLDIDVTNAMAKSLEELTSSGNTSLDPTTMKQFKQLCRKSDDFVQYAFLLIMRHLQRKHSEVRLSAFQVADELFHRSHAFRELLITHLQDFLALTTEMETGQLLPPPKPAAKKLKTDVLKSMQEWNDKFGKAYRKLSVGYDYLKNCKHVDFDVIQAQNLVERERKEEEERKRERLMSDRLSKVLEEIAENKEEIDDCLKEADSCLSLILPAPFDFDMPISPTNENQDDGRIPISFDSKCDQNSQGTLIEDPPDFTKTCDDDSSHAEKRPTTISSDTLLNSYSSNVLEENGETDKEIHSKKGNDEACHFERNEENSGDRRKDDCPGKTCVSEIKTKGFSDVKSAINPSSQDGDNDKVEASEFNSSEEEEEEEEEDMDLQVHGFKNPGFSLTIDMPSDNFAVKETDDNTSIMQSLKDISKLTTGSYLPKVTKWLEILSKNGAKDQDIKRMIDLKLKLESVHRKFLELNIVAKDIKKDDEDSDSDDLEDVPEKEGYEAAVPENLEESKGFLRAGSSLESSTLKRKTSSDASTSCPNPSQEKKMSTSAYWSLREREATGFLRAGSSLESSTLKRKTSSDASTSCPNPSQEKKMSTSAYWSLREREATGLVDDPTSRVAALARIKQEFNDLPSTSKDSQASIPSSSSSSPSSSQKTSSSHVPFVAFGQDLAHWQNPDEIEAPLIVKYDSLHRFWTPAEKETEKASQHEKAALQYRVFNYTGNFEPVKWKCRAPMQNGKLCERMDRVKCPFHGKIIGRDKDGKPSDEKPSDEKPCDEKPYSLAGDKEFDSKNSTAETTEGDDTELPPWKDPQLQKEIEEATGHDLGSSRSQKLLDKASKKGKGKGKGKGKKSSGLTKIAAATCTSRNRLEKKIFSRSSMKKVSARLDAADYKRVRDKFANQFNYSLH